MLEYKGYVGVITAVDENQGVFHGRLICADTVTFEGNTVAEVVQAFHDSVDDYLELLKEDAVSIERVQRKTNWSEQDKARHRAIRSIVITGPLTAAEGATASHPYRYEFSLDGETMNRGYAPTWEGALQAAVDTVAEWVENGGGK